MYKLEQKKERRGGEADVYPSKNHHWMALIAGLLMSEKPMSASHDSQPEEEQDREAIQQKPLSYCLMEGWGVTPRALFLGSL